MATLKTKEIQLLIGPDNSKPYGFRCEHGEMWKATKDELFKAIRFAFEVKSVVVVDQRLDYPSRIKPADRDKYFAEMDRLNRWAASK